MSKLSTAARMAGSDSADRATTEALFKDDRPRRIDQVIDYFGSSETVSPGDPCGETLFEELGSEDE